MWKWGVSPFQILQCVGPLYLKLLSYWTFRRFRNVKENDHNGNRKPNIDIILKLHRYSFSIFNQYQGSGELAITQLVTPEVLALVPLADRGFLQQLANQNIPTLWVYGDEDWMNVEGGKYCVEKLKKLNVSAELVIVENSGHHVYLDNPGVFDDLVWEFLANLATDLATGQVGDNRIE